MKICEHTRTIKSVTNKTWVLWFLLNFTIGVLVMKHSR